MSQLSRGELVERTKSIIQGSHLSKSDKELLEGRVPYIAESILEMFVSVCEEDPFSIDIITRNLKIKLDAQGNLGRLHEIKKQEDREKESDLTIEEEIS